MKPEMIAALMFYDQVTAAISAPADSDMKLEDLETHLNALKQMFIEKQKMMDQMNTVA